MEYTNFILTKIIKLEKRVHDLETRLSLYETSNMKNKLPTKIFTGHCNICNEYFIASEKFKKYCGKCVKKEIMTRNDLN